METNWTSDEPLNAWIEVEETFLTDTPRGTDKPPTEAWLFTWQCRRLKRGIRRKRTLQTIKCAGKDDLAEQLAAFCERPDVRIIEDTRR